MINVVPIAVRDPLFAEPAGRPGDWWEPIPRSAAEVAPALGAEGAKRRLPVDLLAALLLEGAQVSRDIAECGIDAERARSALARAGSGLAATGPGRLHTSYVRMLTNGERDFEHESDAQLGQRDLVLPLRLHEAARALQLPEICDPGSFDEAIMWEIAAATSGQFMREWALRVLLADATSYLTRT